MKASVKALLNHKANTSTSFCTVTHYLHTRYMAKSMFTPDYHTYRNLLDILFNNPSH